MNINFQLLCGFSIIQLSSMMVIDKYCKFMLIYWFKQLFSYISINPIYQYAYF